MKKSYIFAVYSVMLCSLCFTAGWYWGSKKSVQHSSAGNVVKSKAIDKTESISTPDDPAINSESVTKGIGKDFPVIDFLLPAQALLEEANAIEDDSKRHLYLRELLYFWVSNDPNFPKEEREKFLAGMSPDPKGVTFGFVADISRYVAILSDASIREAWKESYSNHPARTEIFSHFLAQDVQNHNPESLFGTSDNWTEWERKYYNDNVLAEWALNEPNRAFAYHVSHPAEFGPTAEQELLDIWAQDDFAGLAAHLDSIIDEKTRGRAIGSLAKHKTFQGTDGALDWANSLETKADQDLAHDTIYRETPRGVGAVIRASNGFPEVVEPLVPNGLQAGDLIVSALNDGAGENTLFGEGMENALDALLGEPGSDVQLQVMRLNQDTGEYEQVEITITRQQLWIEERHEP